MKATSAAIVPLAGSPAHQTADAYNSPSTLGSSDSQRRLHRVPAVDDSNKAVQMLLKGCYMAATEQLPSLKATSTTIIVQGAAGSSGQLQNQVDSGLGT